MCGIVGVILKRQPDERNAANLAVNILKNQEHRGVSSTGIAFCNQGRIEIQKDLGSPTAFANKHAAYLNDIMAMTVIGHNRMPSVGKVTVENAHPFLSCNRMIALVHNGTERIEHVKEFLIGLGHQFSSTTDSEILLHMLEELSIKNGIAEGLKLLKKITNGSSMLVLTNSGNVYGYGYNVVIISDENGFYIASEEDSFKELFRGQRKMVYKPNSAPFGIIDSKLIFYGKGAEKTRKTIGAERYIYRDNQWQNDENNEESKDWIGKTEETEKTDKKRTWWGKKVEELW